MDKSQKRSLLITGANKGIGYALVGKLLSEPTPYDIILTSRDVTLGEKAVSTLKEKYPSSSSTLTYHQLDVNDDQSIDTLFAWVQKNYGKLDVLINNAAAVTSELTDEAKKLVVKTNYFSVIKITEKFLPLLSDDAKILQISSGIGQLQFQGETLRNILLRDDLTEEELNQTAENIVEVTKDWISPFPGIALEPSYSASKALLNRYVKSFLPNKLKPTQQLYAVHPGWVKTDLGGSQAPLSVEEGIDTPYYLTTLPYKKDAELNGELISERKVMGW